MVLELRQSLSLTQQLVMTPQLQQAIKLLQLSRQELLENINQELEENPVLEDQTTSDLAEDVKSESDKTESDLDLPDAAEVANEERVQDDIDWEAYLSEYSTTSYTDYADPSPRDDRDLPSFESMTASKSSLFSHLMWQLNMSHCDEKEKAIGTLILGNLNDDGYLDVSLEEISTFTECPLEQVLWTLRLIQNFDPVGVAARDTRESLLIQARSQNLGGTIVEKIIMDHLKDFENRQYDRIAKKKGVPVKEIFLALTVIRGFEPKPGRSYSEGETVYITPDIYVFKVGDDYEIVQNEDGLPKLRINSYYKEVFRNKAGMADSAKSYVQEKLRSAAWLIKSIHQRQRTIFRVTESIVRFQRGFLDHGIGYLRPLVLRDVAEDIQMHESTISRVTTNKYVYTPQGTFELKFFFNSSVSTVDGDSVASESVREQIRKIVKLENKEKPYSDEEISVILKKLNMKIARRTVAKYRETMGILPSRKRKIHSEANF